MLRSAFEVRMTTESASKVPQVTLAFWIIKCCATTVGETLSDYFAETLNLGLGIAAIIFFPLLTIILACQFYAPRYIPAIYWLSVVFMSICGTIATDGLHDDLGVELWIEVIIFGFLVGCTFATWYYYEGTLDIHSIKTPRREAFFWLAVIFTFAMGTAIGDGVSEAAMVGYGFTLLIFASALIFIGGLWYFKVIEPISNFWMAYIMTRPLGAACGDLLASTKSNHAAGLGTATTSLIFSLIIVCNVIYLTYTGTDVAIDPEEQLAVDKDKEKEDDVELAKANKRSVADSSSAVALN